MRRQNLNLLAEQLQVVDLEGSHSQHASSFIDWQSVMPKAITPALQ